GDGAAQGSRAQGARGGQRAQRPQARIVITDVMGDTVQTLTGPATPGVHRVTWNYRTRGTGEREPLSPSQLRDSVLTARRRDFVLDSLQKAGTFPEAVVTQLKSTLASGDMGALRRGGGGGGRGESGEWNARPGEGPVTPPPGERPRGQAPAPGQADVMGSIESFPGGFRAFQELLRPPGVRTTPSFGGFGGGGSGVTESGDFLVTLVVNGVESRQLLRVEAAPGGDQAGGRFVSEEEEEGDR
ncbi:MAG TPA: hypothetical protein VGE02_07560, partial [Gemmatimonadales bacterium]